MLFVKADSKEQYLKVKSGIIDYLKDIICRLTLRLTEKSLLLKSFAKIVTNYLRMTQGIPRPWDSSERTRRRAIELRYAMQRMKHVSARQNAVASSAAGAA